MSWFYDMLTTSGVAAEQASWCTGILAIILVYCILRGIAMICKS